MEWVRCLPYVLMLLPAKISRIFLPKLANNPFCFPFGLPHPSKSGRKENLPTCFFVSFEGSFPVSWTALLGQAQLQGFFLTKAVYTLELAPTWLHVVVSISAPWSFHSMTCHLQSSRILQYVKSFRTFQIFKCIELDEMAHLSMLE